MENPLISIIIPAKNGATTIGACLKGIFTQTFKEFLEVIIVDSGSTDGTLEIIKQFPVKLYQIPPNEFNHGLTRNLGILKAMGEFVVLTVQDAIPSANNWLEIMFQNFKDKSVAGVCGQQIVPHELDKNPLDWFRPYSEPIPRFVEFKPGEFEKLIGKEQHKYCGWDNVNAMYRKSALIETPFIETNFAEDSFWAKTALLKGYRLVYDYNSRVFHYHQHTFSFTFKRTYTVQHHTKLFFGYKRVYQNFFKSLLKIFYRIFIMKHVPRKKVYWLVYNLGELFAQYSALFLFGINSLFLSQKRLEKAHKNWVGKPPQASVKK